MRRFFLTPCLAAVAVLTGCVPVLSLHPLVGDKEAVVDRTLMGTWQDADGERWAILGRPDSSYDVIVSAPGRKSEAYRARLVRLGNWSFADITRDTGEPLAVPCHMLARVRLEGDTLRVAVIGTGWLAQRIAARGAPAHERLGPQDLLLTAPASELRKLVLEFAAEPRAFEEESILRRVRERAARFSFVPNRP